MRFKATDRVTKVIAVYGEEEPQRFSGVVIEVYPEDRLVRVMWDHNKTVGCYMEEDLLFESRGYDE